MTGTICCVPACKNNSKRNKNISFHSFPNNINIRKEWIRRINRKLWEPKKYDKICGVHFNASGRKSPNDKSPKYFPDGRVFDSIEHNTNQEDKVFKYVDTKEDFDLALDITINNTFRTSQSTQTEDNILDEPNDHMYSISENLMPLFKKYQYDKDQLLHKMEDLENEIKRLTQENGNLYKKVVELSSNISSLEYQLRKQKPKVLDVNNVLKNNAMLQFYTGFESVERFKIFADSIEPGYNLARHNLEGHSGRRCILSFTEQLFLILCRLRLGFLEQDLAYRFNISIATVSSLWSFWVDLLSSELCQIPMGS